MTSAMISATAANDFLGETYEIPQSGGNGGKYLKFKQGTVHFRILSQKALKGWEYWTSDNKPKRVLKRPESTPTDIRIGEDGKPERTKHFWAMAVWDYDSSAVKILQITQATVQEPIMTFVQDKDFGHPTNYDLKVSRSGEGLETKYTVMPLHKPMPAEAAKELADKPVYLEALLYGADPFSADSAQYVNGFKTTPLVFPHVNADNLARLGAIRELTGHTKAQVKSIASAIGLTAADCAKWSDAEVETFRDRMFADWAMGQGAGFGEFNDAMLALVNLKQHWEFEEADHLIWAGWMAAVANHKSEFAAGLSAVEPEDTYPPF